jgi:hypothetical protein
MLLHCPVPKPANRIPGGSKILPGEYSVFAFSNVDTKYKKQVNVCIMNIVFRVGL